MNDIKLEQANILQKKITIAKDNLCAWENSIGFTNSEGPHIQWRSENGSLRGGVIPVTPETFGVIKDINIVHFRAVVAQLQKEYEEL